MMKVFGNLTLVFILSVSLIICFDHTVTPFYQFFLLSFLSLSSFFLFSFLFSSFYFFFFLFFWSFPSADVFLHLYLTDRNSIDSFKNMTMYLFKKCFYIFTLKRLKWLSDVLSIYKNIKRSMIMNILFEKNQKRTIDLNSIILHLGKRRTYMIKKYPMKCSNVKTNPVAPWIVEIPNEYLQRKKYNKYIWSTNSSSRFVERIFLWF